MLLMRNFIIMLLVYKCVISTGSREELSRLHKWKKHSKFASLYYLAKDYLNNANIYNTTVEFTIPLFSFTFPATENPSDYTSLIKQNVLGQVIFFKIIIVTFILSIAFPVFINEIAPKSRMFSNLQYYHNLLSDTLTRNYPNHVNIRQCLLHAGCEGYTNYKEYGLMALPFQYIFLSTAEHNISQWRNNHKCNTQFHCPFSVLRLLRYVAHTVFKFIQFT